MALKPGSPTNVACDRVNLGTASAGSERRCRGILRLNRDRHRVLNPLIDATYSHHPANRRVVAFIAWGQRQQDVVALPNPSVGGAREDGERIFLTRPDDRINAHPLAAQLAHGVLGLGADLALGHSNGHRGISGSDPRLGNSVGFTDNGNLGRALDRPQAHDQPVAVDEVAASGRRQRVP